MTTRGLRTVAFMTGRTWRPPAGADGPGGARLRRVLDARQVADDLIGEDLAAGLLTADEARKCRTAEEYQSGVVRAFAALAGLGPSTTSATSRPTVPSSPASCSA